MKRSESIRVWSKVLNISGYPNFYKAVRIAGDSELIRDASLEFNSGITAICGKNGVGKSTLLKAIASSVGGHTSSSFNKSKYDVRFTPEKVCSIYYVDPSSDISLILKTIESTDNFSELLEGVDPIPFFNKDTVRSEIGEIVGKRYSSIRVYELEGVLSSFPELVFPYFQVDSVSGINYSSSSMGTGELLCLYVVWYFYWIDKNSFLMIEEMENSISPYSQVKLMDYIAKRSFEKSIQCLMTTHSENILQKVGLDNVRILSNCGKTGSRFVKPQHKSKYLECLGVSPHFDGALLVEDSCAAAMCKEVISKYNPRLLRDKEIVGLSGESNISKMITHFIPAPTVSYNFIAVFDADMNGNLPRDSSHVPLFSLPSVKNLPPEIELWEFLECNPSCVASALSISIEELDSAININESIDHHERFIEISRLLNTEVGTFRSILIKQWMKKHDELLAEFVLALSGFGKPQIKSELIRLVDIISEQSGSALDGLRARVEALSAGKFVMAYKDNSLNIEMLVASD